MGLSPMLFRNSSAAFVASEAVECGRKKANSSLPNRGRTSLRRMVSRQRRLVNLRASTPTAWHCVSLAVLKASTSIIMIDASALNRRTISNATLAIPKKFWRLAGLHRIGCPQSFNHVAKKSAAFNVLMRYHGAAFKEIERGNPSRNHLEMVGE
jgi:hypothetical protein